MSDKAKVLHDWETMQGHQWHVRVSDRYFIVSYSRPGDETLAFHGHKNDGYPDSHNEIFGARGKCLGTILDRLVEKYGR